MQAGGGEQRREEALWDGARQPRGKQGDAGDLLSTKLYHFEGRNCYLKGGNCYLEGGNGSISLATAE